MKAQKRGFGILGVSTEIKSGELFCCRHKEECALEGTGKEGRIFFARAALLLSDIAKNCK